MNLPAEYSAEDRLAASWIRKMEQAEVESLNALYGIYHRPLYSLVFAILRDSFEAEEVLQDTFVRAYRQAGRFNPEVGTPFAWLVTIGKRLAIDRLRRRRARPDFLSDEREHPDNSADKVAGKDETSIHEDLEVSWLQDCLKDLNPARRKAIELAFFGGYTHNEIAQKLKKPLGTVKSDLSRGLVELRKAYLNSND